VDHTGKLKTFDSASAGRTTSRETIEHPDEIELTRHNKALMKFLDARGKQTKTVGSGE